MFDLALCHIRFAREGDRNDLLKIARSIWAGHDYLPRVMDDWLTEPWFLVCEYQGRVIACLKLTLLPDKVLWFEGLRVHARWQGKGIATLMNRHCFELAQQIRESHGIQSYEFSTYYLNVESLHLTQKLGFRIVEKFYALDKRGILSCQQPDLRKDIDLASFEAYPRHIPCAWHAIHNSPDSIGFLSRYGTLFQTPYATYYYGGMHRHYILLLQPPSAELKKDLPCFQHFFGSRKSYSIIIPEAFSPTLPLLYKHGFRIWGDDIVPNMYVLAMPPP